MPFSGTVLQVIPALEAGGAERTTVEIARAILDAGGRALVASNGGRLEKELEAAGAEIFHLPAHSKNPITMRRNAAMLADLVRQHGVDILHPRSRAPAWSALWAARASGAKLVATYHGAFRAQSALKRFYNSGLVRADLVIANSDFTARSIAKHYDLTRDRLVTIPRGADLSAFDPAALAQTRVDALMQAWGLAPDNGAARAFRLLAPGRLTPWKGQEDVIRALAMLAKKPAGGAWRPIAGEEGVPRFDVVFCGDSQGKGAFEHNLQQEIEALDATLRVRLVGHCADMAAAYGWADAVLAPSRRPEAFGRVAVEAGAMQTPVIASAHGGALETVIDGETGILFPPEDVEALAEAIEQLSAGLSSMREKMGVAARAHVAENYSVKAMCEATLLAYERVMAA